MLKRLAALSTLALLPAVAFAEVTAVKAGRLIDPETGTAVRNPVILIEDGRFTAVGAGVAIPPGATVIDLLDLTLLPGLVDAHTHMALTYKEIPESNVYYLTYVLDSTPLRAIQAASGSRWCATWATTRSTPTSRCAWRSSRAGCRGRR
jgi:imidazolonepropionase-like amidohydrolase